MWYNIYLDFRVEVTIEGINAVCALPGEVSNLEIVSPRMAVPKPSMSRLPPCKIGLQNKKV